MMDYIEEGKEFVKFVAQTVISYCIADKQDDWKKKDKVKRLQKILKVSIKNVCERYWKENSGEDYKFIKWDKEDFKKCDESIDGLTEKVLNPLQTSEKLLKSIGWIFEKYIYNGSEDDSRIGQQVVEIYLEAVRYEITTSNVGEKILELENLVVDVKQQVEGTYTARETEEKNAKQAPAKSTVYYRELYEVGILGDSQIPLKEVYVEHQTQDGRLISEVVSDFLVQDQENLLVIEGAPGVGKTSMMARLANLYTDSRYFFLKLENEVLSTCENLVKILREIDDKWKEFDTKGNIVFLDGYDEVMVHLTLPILENFIKVMKNKKVKVVITTRPGYINDGFVPGHIHVVLGPYTEDQIKEWIRKYYEYSAPFDNEAVISDKIECLMERKSDPKFMELVGIPLILAMIHYYKIEIKNITSLTELFDLVFESLKEDKIFDKPYVDEVAMGLGFFLQNSLNSRLEQDDISRFIDFMKLTFGIELEKDGNHLSEILGNSFIRHITEGTEVREFYHKSIRDYFSAKYVFEHLKDADCVADYIGLSDKHMIREEIPYLKYWLDKHYGEDKKRKEELGTRLQHLFVEAFTSDKRIPREEWYLGGQKLLQEYGGLMPLEDTEKRVKAIFDNHILIMHDIFDMPIIQDAELMIKHPGLTVALRVAYGCEELGYKAQFLWKAFKHLQLSSTVLSFAKINSELFVSEVFIEKCTMIALTNNASINPILGMKLIECKALELVLNGGNFKQSYVMDFLPLCGKIKDVVFEGGIFGDTTFTFVKFVNVCFRDINSKKGSCFSNVKFEGCEFKNVRFERCDLRMVIFSTEEGIEFIDCMR